MRGARTTKVVSGRAAFGAASDLIATKVIIGMNVAVYVLMVATGGSTSGASGPIFTWGATYGPLVAQGDWYRLVSGGFLHATPLHLGMNMFLLWLLGRALEPALGRSQFVAIYMVSLLGGSLGVMLLDPTSPTLGASGAIFGLMGALTVFQLRAGQNPWRSGIGTLIALNLVLTFMMPGISLGGHVGGLIAGSVAAWGLSVLAQPKAQGSPGVPIVTRLVGLAAFGALLGVISIMVVSNQQFLLVPG